jgi:hypothetical protein
VGYAPFLVHPSALTFSYGGRTFYELAVRRYSLTSQPLLLNEHRRAEEVVTSLLMSLRKDLTGRELAFGLGIPIDSPFWRVVSAKRLRALFHVIRHGPPYQRRLFPVPKSLDDYLAALGSKTRQDLRRQERRLLKQTGGDVRVSVHVEASGVPALLKAVEAISRQTYQWRQLQMGIRDTEARQDELGNAARKGWLRGYVLHCRETPVAFMIGYLYRGVYYSESIGYDPTWSEWSVGNVLHLHVVRDLTRNAVGARRFDFMYGDNSNKERLSTEARMEGNYYFVRRRWSWTPIVLSYRAFDGGTSAFTAAFDRFGVKGRIKRFLRARAQD